MSSDIKDVTSKLLDIYTMSEQELNDYISQGNFVISRAVDCTNLPINELEGGWKLHTSKPINGTLNSILFIIPTKPQSQRIWDVGQYRIGRNAGLTSRKATRWVRANHKFKYEFLPALVEVLKDENLIKAFINYSADLQGQEYQQWLKTYNIHQYQNDFWYRMNKSNIRTLLVCVCSTPFIEANKA